MIDLININKNFPLGDSQINVLKNINLHIDKGEFVAIIGQSGSGKSTLMNIIGCLDTPSSGEYKIENRDVAHFTSDDLANLRSKKFGFVFQRYNLISSMNALENVALPAVYAGASTEFRTKRAKEILNELDLKDKMQNLPNKLSGGQQQRVSIARALINGGEIILADEPTGALDSKSGETVMQIFTNLYKKGHTIIMVTHDKHVASYASRVIEIKDGEILSDTRKNDEIFELKNEEIVQKNVFSSYKDKFIESFKMSVSAIFSHKLRSVLTMLGIIIGISSVICVVALGKGSQEKIISSIRAIGTNTINIMPGKSAADARLNKIKTLTIEDSNVLANQPYIDYSTPNTSANGLIAYANLSSNGILSGGGANSLAIRSVELQSGRNFTDDDIKNSASVVIIDQNTVDTFFTNTDPIGKILLFKNRPLLIIGTAENEKFSSQDRLKIYAPYTTVMNKISGNRDISSITVKISDNVSTKTAEDSITAILTKRHIIKDFHTRNSDTIKETIKSTMGTMRLLISSIAVISLIVGGIGVMNIMLVSVTERTKEIGVRMAIGAKESNILEQFLIEAILLCSIGGVLGIIIALGFGAAFNSVSSDFVMKFSLMPAITALIASCAIGIVFGYLPARNASRLNPIDALSQE